MDSKSHFLSHFIPGILIGSIVGTAFGALYVAKQIPSVTVSPQPSENEIEESPSELYAVGNIAFRYPAGWHVMSRSTYDNTKRILPEHEVYLNPQPIHFVSPSDFSTVNARVHIYAADEGEAVLAPYESDVFWQESTSDSIVINGVTADRIRLSVGPKSVYSPLFSEVIFFGGYVVTYEYSDVKDAEDPNWLLIRDSLKRVQ